MLISKVVQTIKEHYKLAVAIAICVFIAIVGVWIYHHKQKQLEKPVEITQEQAKSPQELSKAIHITEQEAQEVISKKERTQPIATYYTQAPTVKVAAEQVKKDVTHSNPNVPKAVTEKSDRTAVVANTDAQKVDVYNINLNKGHKIKAGVTLIDKKAYETIGYQAGKFEVLTHFNGQHLEGGSALYTVKEW
ncbi:hypothetical protein [Veillonella tobetsuensis]|uniref:hypothetical protein n=1 Tax=Veillonella tobetsuensis TaxID=1110546 RepID=UPI00248E63A0|nr:hypothetical protein [Veillonella tobetsuensis]